MSARCDHDGLLARFASRTHAVRAQAVADAYADPHADALFAEMLDRATGFDRVMLAAHLGDLRGEAGTQALLRASAVTGAGTRDLRCASVLALAKRCGAEATPWLRDALQSPDGTVKDYAVIGLAGAGAADAWDDVVDRLEALLRRKTRSAGQSEVAMALAYLARHVQDDGRRRTLVELVRRRWNAIDEPAWFEEHWSDAQPGGPPAGLVAPPDQERIRRWAREPLFRPLGAPEW